MTLASDYCNAMPTHNLGRRDILRIAAARVLPIANTLRAQARSFLVYWGTYTEGGGQFGNGDSKGIYFSRMAADTGKLTRPELAAESQVVLICGRYEGMDDRVAGLVGAEAVSIGDFVLAGGDMAALVVIEAVARLVPGVLGNLDSLAEESFTGGLLEYPQYTRPAEIGGLKVPEVLLSGDHGRIARWRREQSLRRTFERRPDLIDAAIDAAELSDSERDLVAAWRALLSSNSRPFPRE